MNIIIKTKNIELDEYLEKFINEKIGKIGKFLSPDNQEIFVEIEKESNHHKKGDIFCAEIMVQMPGKKLMAIARESNIQKALTEAKKEMEMEIKKHKTKMVEAPRREAKKSRKEMF